MSISNLNKLVGALVSSVQALENTAADLYKFRSLYLAVGTQLDGIGEIVGEPRQGLLDDKYRSAIITKIFLNTSSGEAETIITMMLKVTDSPTVKLIELFPASVRVELNADKWPVDFQARAKRAVAAGVDLAVVNFTGTNIFKFDTPGHGFNQGQFSAIIA